MDGSDGPLADPAVISPMWEQKSVAVLAIEVTFPTAPPGQAATDAPGTAARHWEAVLVAQVQALGGVVLQRSPSLLLVAFGLPQALEQVPQRAVQAALMLQTLVSEGMAGAPCPELRQAVHAGQLLVDVSASDPTARLLPLGEVLALPVRLLGYAVAGEILASAAVGHLVEGWCAGQPHAGPPGIETRLVTGLTPRPSPLCWQGRRPLSRFVGRARELATLTDLLAQATEGRGQVVGIVGEPGIGKSRLLAEFQQHVQTQSIPAVEGQCLAYGQAMPFGPVLALLRQSCGMTEADAPEVVAAKVRLTLQTAGIDPDEAAPYVGPLLGLPVGRERLAHLSPERRKAQTFETLRHLYLASTSPHPRVLAVENLHWIDPTSEAFLASLIASLAGARVFVLLTYRPGYRPPWIDKSYATQMVLPPLSAEDSQRMLASVLPTAMLSAPLAQQILTKAEGNPFFLEELAQTLVDQSTLRPERGIPLPPTLQLPATVQDVLGARIDQLPLEEERLLQAAAVIGKDVPFAVLQAITELSEEALHRGLASLQAAEFLYETRSFPVREYTFKHALTHDVAYGSLHQERRRMMHARTVEALEASYADRLAEQVERLAYHALRGEMWAKAVTYCQQAGARARDRAAFREAVAAFEQALQALAHLPESGDTRLLAIDLRLAVDPPLNALGEYGRCLALLGEAEALARALDDRARLGRVLAQMADGLRYTGDLEGAMAAGQQALEIAVELDDRALQVQTFHRLGQVYATRGDFGRAAELLRRNVEPADRGPGTPSTFVQLHSRAWLAWTLSVLGAFAEGRRHGEEALRLATLEGRGSTPIVVRTRLGHLYLTQGDLEPAIQVLEQGLALCRASGDRNSLRLIVAGLGYAYALQGRLAEGRVLLEEAISESTRTGARNPRWLAWLSEVCRLAGGGEEAWQHARRALDVARQRKTRGDEALALHQLGVLQAHADPPDATRAESYYQQALALAEALLMRPLQAHCHFGLGTLYAKIGRPEQARAKLSSAIELYHAMDMTFWLPQAEAALTKAR